jgi:tRNA (guanine37-N1)-methyltransferase
MLLKPDPLFACVESLGVAPRANRISAQARESVVMLSASGKMFSQAMAQQLASLDRVTFVCGRYEGVDERVTECLADCEVSVGDFVMSGGELGAMLMLDCITRLLPGALGNEASNKTESFSAVEAEARWDELGRLEPDSTVATGGLLDYPHYTRPAEFRGIPVPDVLLQGNHEEIRRWRRRRALEKTLRNRPDLLEKVALSAEDKAVLRELQREAEKI